MPLTATELQEMKTAMDEAVAKRMQESESRTKSQAIEIASLLEKQAALETTIKAMDRRLLLNPESRGVKYHGRLSNEFVARGFGLAFLSLAGGPNQAKYEKMLCDEYGVIRGQVEGTEGAGGLLVANELRSELIRLLVEYGIFRRKARNVPLSTGGQTMWPKRASGVVVYNPAEAVAITQSQMSFSSVSMTPKKWACLTAISSELSEDAIIAIGELVAVEMAYAIAKKEDECGFLGDGTSTYFNINGLFNAVGSAGVHEIAGNTFAEWSAADGTSVIAKIQDYAEAGAEWYMHRVPYFTGLVARAFALGGVTAEEVRQNAFRGNRTYLGYPVNLINAGPKTDANSQVFGVFGDLKTAAYLGDRRAFSVVRSTEAFFTSDQIGIRGTQRVDIVVSDPGDASNVGSYVALKSAAA